MEQISLFDTARIASDAITTVVTSPTSVSGTAADAERLRPSVPTHEPVPAPSALVAELQAQTTAIESDLIVQCLRARTHEEFRRHLGLLLEPSERELVEAAGSLPYQLAHVYDQICERLSKRWGELHDWPPFARVIEPSTELKRGLRACTLELFPPGSRGLHDRIAFRIEPNLRRISDPIPGPVLRLMRESHAQGFAAYAYLEPIFGQRGRGGNPTVLRSLDEVRRQHCRPIDPLICAVLGTGPVNYGLRFPHDGPDRRSQSVSGRRRNSNGTLVWLIGHWD